MASNKSTITLFSLPSDILISVQDHIKHHQKQQDSTQAHEETRQDPLLSKSTRSCQTCQLDFETQQEFRQHFKTLEHLDNMKRKLTESMESISISSSKATEALDGSTIVVERKDGMIKFLIRKSNVEFQIMKMVLLSSDNRQEQDDVTLLKRLLLLNSAPSKWATILFSGGDFAICLFENEPRSSSYGKILNHKTLHRYTVRRKQGGSQSGKDNQGGNKPKSAGAMMRRRNEQLLQQDISELLSSSVWRDALVECDRVWIYAPGNINRNIIDSSLDQIIPSENQDRIVNIGLNVSKPTFEECKRVYDLLTVTTIRTVG